MIFGRFSRYLIVAVGLLALGWLLGLLAFVQHIGALTEPAIDANMKPTDAIVVLTGGSDRLTTGIELLKAGKAKKLFISGVHHGLTLEPLLANQNVPPALRQCCVLLGHTAESTHGNAEETLGWMTGEGYRSLRLVTANYHMPRSLLIFHAAMPDLDIIPHPVNPESVRLDAWWDRPGTASLLVTEYTKFLWAWLRRDLLSA